MSAVLPTIPCKSTSPVSRWTPVNSCKNESMTVIFQCGWSGERITVPAQAPSKVEDNADYFDEATSDETDIRGFTTLQESIHG